MKASYVYILIHEKGEMFKIGKANNIKSRIEQLEKHWGTFQLDNSMILKVKSEKESLNLERMLHRLFEKYNLKDLRKKDGSSEFFKIECLDILIENLYTMSTTLDFKIFVVKDIFNKKVIRRKKSNENHSDNLIVFNNEKISKMFFNLFYYSIMKLEKLNYDKYEIKISVRDFENTTNKRFRISDFNLDKFGELLNFMKQPFYYKNSPVNFAENISYNNETKIITITLNGYSIIKYKHIFKSVFDSKYFKNFSSFESTFSQMLYINLLLLRQSKVRSFNIPVIKLSEILGILGKYPNFWDFKKRALNIALSEINKKTNLNVDFKEIKSGRKVENLKFQIKTQK